MAALKSAKNDGDVLSFLESNAEGQKLDDCKQIYALMKEITGEEPSMWGGSIIGYGSYHYKYESGREGDWFLTGFSPRKQNISIYIMAGFDRYPELMDRLGKFKTGKSCLYIKKLEDIDRDILKELVKESVQYLKKKYPAQ
jgi:hypothetical protein